MSQATLRIGVSGHQQIGDEETVEFVSQQLRELLAMFQCQAQERGQNMLAYSAVALGTDQLFVKIALEMGIPVELVIPCSQYAVIFSATEARNEYHHLLSRCQDVHRLPFDDCSEDAFLAAGHWIVYNGPRNLDTKRGENKIYSKHDEKTVYGSFQGKSSSGTLERREDAGTNCLRV